VSKPECVLVVDEISDIAEVLQAVLEPRGLAVNRVRRLSAPAVSGDSDRPSVIVLDTETLARAVPRSSSGWQNVPQVIIGTIPIAESGAADDRIPHPRRRYLQKPFQFAELLKAIESLIASA
jgi:DNA-binding response OmpR family regulator